MGRVHMANIMKMDKDKLAATIVDGLELKTDMGREIVLVALDCIKLFDDKQQDYGSENIAATGEIGIAVRLQDKVARMRHILIKALRGDNNVNNESLADTYKDVANYGLIGWILNNGKWK